MKAYRPDAFDALAAENLNLKRAASERDMYREQLEDARRRWQEAERRVAELQVSSTRTTEELGARVRSAEALLASAREDIGRAEANAEKLRQEVAAQQDNVKIKVAMLDSANDTIASLKAEIVDLQVEADEARRAAEEAEAALAREQQQHDHEDEESDGEKTQLRQEAQAAESAAAAARVELTEAQSRVKELEGQLRTKMDQISEKDRMLTYVQEEVDRVQGKYEWVQFPLLPPCILAGRDRDRTSISTCSSCILSDFCKFCAAGTRLVGGDSSRAGGGLKLMYLINT
ncbi:hypothetical protein Vretifemale_1676 [Volvox reticuliferus]|uniref:Uncharacterized protein n=1 Tax=Volvox reticuliferus TaxID=1737510 RepID=A0A8J4BZ22_9CHLO|nr:hypothetical protein Vretifemale_1676 [Volvox reticuliferus]